jgi:hypothetical protein
MIQETGFCRHCCLRTSLRCDGCDRVYYCCQAHKELKWYKHGKYCHRDLSKVLNAYFNDRITEAPYSILQMSLCASRVYGRMNNSCVLCGTEITPHDAGTSGLRFVKRGRKCTAALCNDCHDKKLLLCVDTFSEQTLCRIRAFWTYRALCDIFVSDLMCLILSLQQQICGHSYMKK